MEGVIITLAIIGLVSLLIACTYIIIQLHIIHTLVNSRLSEALQRIDSLEKQLVAAGQIVPAEVRAP